MINIYSKDNEIPPNLNNITWIFSALVLGFIIRVVIGAIICCKYTKLALLKFSITTEEK